MNRAGRLQARPNAPAKRIVLYVQLNARRLFFLRQQIRLIVDVERVRADARQDARRSFRQVEDEAARLFRVQRQLLLAQNGGLYLFLRRVFFRHLFDDQRSAVRLFRQVGNLQEAPFARLGGGSSRVHDGGVRLRAAEGAPFEPVVLNLPDGRLVGNDQNQRRFLAQLFGESDGAGDVGDRRPAAPFVFVGHFAVRFGEARLLTRDDVARFIPRLGERVARVDAEFGADRVGGAGAGAVLAVRAHGEGVV